MHLNLLIQEDEVKISQSLEEEKENISSTTDSSQEVDLSKIIVEDPYSDIKKCLKNILINRCSVKMEELHQYCIFETKKELPVNVKAVLAQGVQNEYNTEKTLADTAL